jgi:hypothetical protein
MDITMCKGNGCLLSQTCKRYTSTPSQHQSWFTDEPFRVVEGKFHCDLYWAVNQTNIFDNQNEDNDKAGADRQTDGAENGIREKTKGDTE